MTTGRFGRLIATSGVVALTLGAGALVTSQAAAARLTMTATTYVNMRSGPGTSYEVLDVLAPGQSVDASGTTTNGWYEVTTDEDTGWVYKNYLAASATSPDTDAPEEGTPTSAATPTTAKPTATASAAPSATASAASSSPKATPTATATATPKPATPASTSAKPATPATTSAKPATPASTSAKSTTPAATSAKPSTPASTSAKPSTATTASATSTASAKPTVSTSPTSAAPTPTATPSVAAVAAVATRTVTTTTAVNVRSGPGTSYGIVAVASKGMQLTATGTLSGNWTQVLYQGTPRWISSTYLVAGTSTPAPATTGQLRTTTSLYLRTAGTISAPYDGVLPANSVVDATGQTTASYSEIVYQGKTRWIATSYTTAVPVTSPSVPAAPTASASVWVAVDELNVRATSDPNSAVVGVVYQGAELRTTGAVVGTRTEVIYLGAARWVYTPYVSTSKATAAQALSIPTGVTTSGMTQLNTNAKQVVSYVLANFPRIRTIYGWRASSAYSSDHPNGRAVDIMIPTWTDPANAEYGWQVARYFAANAAQFKVNYIIYRQSVYNVAYPSRGWRPMEDRGSATQNHYDHVHVSVFA